MAITIDGTNGLSSDNAALKLDGTTLAVDETNNRVGVGTASPAVAMDVVGQVRASTGILFGSDTAAANALDDYEEGTWTATVVTGTITSSNGNYRKIGSLVTVWIAVTTFSDRSSAQPILIGGLPFSALSTADDVAVGAAMWRYSNLNGSAVYIDSSSKLQFYAGTTSGDFVPVAHNNLNNASAYVYLVATYIAA